MKADVAIEDEEFGTLQRSPGVQGAGKHVAAGAQAGLVWMRAGLVWTAAQVQQAGRQETEKPELLAPASVFAHGSDDGHAAAAAAAYVLDAASFVAAQGGHCQTALLQQGLELGR